MSDESIFELLNQSGFLSIEGSGRSDQQQCVLIDCVPRSTDDDLDYKYFASSCERVLKMCPT